MVRDLRTEVDAMPREKLLMELRYSAPRGDYTGESDETLRTILFEHLIEDEF